MKIAKSTIFIAYSDAIHREMCAALESKGMWKKKCGLLSLTLPTTLL